MTKERQQLGLIVYVVYFHLFMKMFRDYSTQKIPDVSTCINLVFLQSLVNWLQDSAKHMY